MKNKRGLRFQIDPFENQFDQLVFIFRPHLHIGRVDPRNLSQDLAALVLEREVLLRQFSCLVLDKLELAADLDPFPLEKVGINPKCGGQMEVIASLTDYAVVDRIINNLKLTFTAERPPAPHIAYQEILMAAETPAEYFS